MLIITATGLLVGVVIGYPVMGDAAEASPQSMLRHNSNMAGWGY
jgi:hypothetical protein